MEQATKERLVVAAKTAAVVAFPVIAVVAVVAWKAHTTYSAEHEAKLAAERRRQEEVEAERLQNLLR